MAYRRRARLVDATMLSPSVRGLGFEVEGAPLEYEPGQAVDLFVASPGSLPLKRAYSIASAPDPSRPRRLELAVTRVVGGLASTALHDLPIGSVLDLYGPRGGFVRHEGDRDLPTLFVAAGSGLAPLRAMLQAELARREGPEVRLLFGCRSAEDILWRDELASWTEQLPRFSAWITLSRPTPDWKGRSGYVQAHVAELASRLRPSRVYVCGLSRMTLEVERALEPMGLARGQVRTEQYDR